MKRFRNNLGWYLYKSRSGLEIRRKYLSKKSLIKHIAKKILIWASAIIIFALFLFAKDYPPDEVLSFIIVPSLILIIIVIPSKFWLLEIIGIQSRTSSLVINGVIINSLRRNPRLPCFLFNVEINHDSESDLYRVYLRPSEFLKIEGYSEDFNPLVWETTNEQEATQIVEELRQCGVGEKNQEKQCPVIPGNKKIGIAVLACWILCLFAVLSYVKKSLQPDISNPDSTESLLLMVKTVVIFGLLSIIVYACYNIWFGVMAIKDRQIPSSRTIFFSEMRLFHGEIAVKRGRKIIAFGCITIIVSLILAIFLNYKLKEMIPSQNNIQTSITNQIQ